MILLKDLLNEVQTELTVYRGVNPIYGNIGLGINSTKPGDKLVATLGANHTDNLEVAKKFGKQIITTKLKGPGLKLSHYNNIIEFLKLMLHIDLDIHLQNYLFFHTDFYSRLKRLRKKLWKN